MASLKLSLAALCLCGSAALSMTPEKPEVPPPPQFDRLVPVMLFNGKSLDIEIEGSAALECYRGTKLSEVYYFSSEIKFVYDELGIQVIDHNGVLTIGLTEFRCKPRNELTFLRFNGRSYRGYLRGVHRADKEVVSLINMIDLEEYLAGVLPGEIGERTVDEYEAAKAQAVAARTYAVWKISNGGSNSMLFPTVADQVYLGRDSEIELLTRAVFETTGEILTFNFKPIAAYYHAVCGGTTIPVERAWPEKGPEEYLKGVGDDDYCAWAKTYSWVEAFAWDTLRINLQKYFSARGLASERDFDSLAEVEFEFDERDGRAAGMSVTTNGGTYEVDHDQIRWAMGRPSVPGAILPSTRFDFNEQTTDTGEKRLVFAGRGNGHGVGFCQCGAIGRARAGQDYEKILKSYYKGVRIERIY